MQTITIIIERSKDCYSAYAANVEGIYGVGDTIDEVKESIANGISLLKEHNKPEHIPDILKGDYNLEYIQDYLEVKL